MLTYLLGNEFWIMLLARLRVVNNNDKLKRRATTAGAMTLFNDHTNVDDAWEIMFKFKKK